MSDSIAYIDKVRIGDKVIIGEIWVGKKKPQKLMTSTSSLRIGVKINRSQKRIANVSEVFHLQPGAPGRTQRLFQKKQKI